MAASGNTYCPYPLAVSGYSKQTAVTMTDTKTHIMRHLLIFLLTLLTSCLNPSKSNNHIRLKDSTQTLQPKKEISQHKLTVLVLPPFDEIANEGISPDIQQYLETEFLKDSSIILIKFPLKKLMGVPYQMVFDKKFCKPIIDKIKTDIIVMSKLDQVLRSGSMINDKWKIQFRIYNTNTEIQINSTVSSDSLTTDEIKDFLTLHRDQMIKEIINNH